MIIKIDTRKRGRAVIELLKSGNTIQKKVYADPVDGIRKIMEENNLLMGDIDKFEMVNEPGSFTGLKVGASIVNALNFAKGAKFKYEDIVIPNYGAEPFIGKKSKVS